MSKRKNYQFGSGLSVTPQSSAAQFEYKPLGLEAFAQPLAMKQQRFDTAQSAIEQSDFGIGALNADDERASAITKEITDKKEELMENLLKTKNFKGATKKLQELNKLYNSDPEVQAIQSQRAAFLKADEEAKKRVGKEGYTQKDYEEWRFKTLNSYGEQGGLAFNRETGSHNQINTDLRGKNLEKEIMTLARTAANSAPAQIIENIKANDAFSTVDTDVLMQTLLKTKDKDQVATEVGNFLRQSERYNDWVSEDADYEYYSKSRQVPGFNESVVQDKYALIDSYETQLASLIADPSTDAQTKTDAQSQLAELQSDKAAFISLHDKAVREDNLEGFAEAVFKEDKISNRLAQIGDASADLVDMNSITHTMTTRSNPAGKAAVEAIKNIGEYQIDTQSGQANTKTTPFTQGGGSGATQIQESSKAIAKNQLELYQDVTNYHPDTEQQYAYNALSTDEDFMNSMNSEQKGMFDILYNDTEYSYSLMKRVDKWDEEIDKTSTEIINLQQSMNTGTVLEKREKRAELNRLQGDLREANVSMQGEFNYIDSLFEEASKQPGGEWINQAMQEGGRRQVFETAYNHNNEILQSLRDANGASVADPAQSLIDAANPTSDPLLLNTDFPEDPFKAQYKSDLLKSQLNNTYGKEVFSKYRDAMVVRDTAVPVEVVINDASNKYTGDYLQKLDTQVKNNAAMSSTAAIPVNFDPGTGTAKRTVDSQQLDYDVNAYYNENPAYVGTSLMPTSNGDAQMQVLRYNRPQMKDAEIKAVLAKELRGGNTQDNRDSITPEEIAVFKKNNPEELYLAVEGTSLNIEREANKTFTELGESAMIANDPYAFEIALSSYAAIDLTTNNRRREDYGEMTTTLKNAYLAKDPKRTVSQPPAYWNDNGNGTFSGYQLEYHYDTDKAKMVADVRMLTYGEGIDGTHVQDITTRDIDMLNAQSIRQMDIIYGVGHEPDVPVNPRTGKPFVAAFTNAAFTNQ